MTPERYGRMTELFRAASRLNRQACPTFVADACEGDDELRQEVEEMLAADEQPGGFLEEPPGDVAVRRLEDQDAMRTQADLGILLGAYFIAPCPKSLLLFFS